MRQNVSMQLLSFYHPNFFDLVSGMNNTVIAQATIQRTAYNQIYPCIPMLSTRGIKLWKKSILIFTLYKVSHSFTIIRIVVSPLNSTTQTVNTGPLSLSETSSAITTKGTVDNPTAVNKTNTEKESSGVYVN